METHQSVKKGVENKNEVAKPRQEDKEGQAAKQASASSSPSHEFSFTTSVHSSSATVPGKSRVPPSFAVDLTPADDIFFHGHLLPLHLLSHFPSSSPRCSTHSVDSFTLPNRESLEDEKPNKENGSFSTSNRRSNISMDNSKERNSGETDGGSKSKSFSLTKGLKGEKEDKEKHKRKLRFDVIHALKRYLRMVKPLVFFRGRRDKIRFRGQAYSYSGNFSQRNKAELRGRRVEYSSAPASMWTSPTNSGQLLLATTTLSPASDSTMEELQAAIQAAIAHCKNSIAKEEKLKCREVAS